jgi:hypothetical protein
MTGLNVPVNQPFWLLNSEVQLDAGYDQNKNAIPVNFQPSPSIGSMVSIIDRHAGEKKQIKHYRKPLASVPQKGIMCVR